MLLRPDVRAIDEVAHIRHKIVLDGHLVAAAVVASGDDGIGLASLLWRADLRVFTTANTNKNKGASAEAFYEEVADEIAR